MIDRYDIYPKMYSDIGIEKDKTGEWVKFEDHVKEMSLKGFFDECSKDFMIPDNRITEKELNNFYESHICYLPGMSICIEDITSFIKSKGWIK